jgi:hypothetical protein
VVKRESSSCYWFHYGSIPAMCNFCAMYAQTPKITWSLHGLAWTPHSPCRVHTDTWGSVNYWNFQCPDVTSLLQYHTHPFENPCTFVAVWIIQALGCAVSELAIHHTRPSFSTLHHPPHVLACRQHQSQESQHPNLLVFSHLSNSPHPTHHHA